MSFGLQKLLELKVKVYMIKNKAILINRNTFVSTKEGARGTVAYLGHLDKPLAFQGTVETF